MFVTKDFWWKTVLKNLKTWNNLFFSRFNPFQGISLNVMLKDNLISLPVQRLERISFIYWGKGIEKSCSILDFEVGFLARCFWMSGSERVNRPNRLLKYIAINQPTSPNTHTHSLALSAQDFLNLMQNCTRRASWHTVDLGSLPRYWADLSDLKLCQRSTLP